MTCRVFSGARITLDEGTLDTFRTNGILTGALSVVATFKRSGSTTDGTQYIFSLSSSGSVRGGLSYTSASLMQFETGGVARTFAGLTLTNDTWYTIVVTKQAGTATPQADLLNHTTGTWSGPVNGSGTLDDDTQVLDQVQIGNRPNDFPLNGKIQGVALYSAVLAQGVYRSLGTGFPYWRAAFPVAMWMLTQSSTATPVTDLVGDADETAITGTTIDTTDNPSNFDQTLSSVVLLDYADAAFTVGSPKTTDDLNWNANGDLVVVLGMTEDNGVPWSGVPTLSGVTLAALSSLPTNQASSCKGGGWSGTASADGNGTVSISLSSSGANTLGAWSFSGHGGVVNPAPVIDAALTVSVTVVGPGSTIVMTLGDWNASADVAVETVPAGGIVRRAQQAAGAATCLILEWHNQAAGTRNYGVSGWTGTGTITKVPAEIKGVAGGGTDLPYDGEGETPLLNDVPASYSQAAAYAADTSAARVISDGLARSAVAVAGNADQRSGYPVRVTAQSAVAVAGAADGLAGRPVAGIARSALSVEMGADSLGAQPVFGLAAYELTGPGAVDLEFDGISMPIRGTLAPVRAQLDELFREIPRPFLLADIPAQGAVDMASGADARTPVLGSNAAAGVLASQALSALARGGWPMQGLALATLGSGAPLPVDVVADFGPVHVSNSLGAPVVEADLTGSVVHGWTP